ncbi:MarR family winged helix-turn-helix transcriptional regulator [Myroides sp. C8-3]|uniref:MarR family winged helix-turn-helix transcriptional regulator n=1 Tax=Myroides sp. C8-3 TaxID=3400533 RepID=UPI003D2F6AE8
MNHKLLIDFMHLLFEFEKEMKEEFTSIYAPTIMGFKQWIRDKKVQEEDQELGLEASTENTDQHIVLSFFKLANYSKTYWRSLLTDTPLALPDNHIFLMNLWRHGEMTKMELIRKSTQEKATGMQIINRLIELNFVSQKDSEVDKRSKIVEITSLGRQELETIMDDIQKISQVVNGSLKGTEKKMLNQLLNKLTHFHEEVFSESKSKEELIFLIVNHEK